MIVTIKIKHSKAACTAELYFHTVLFRLLHHVLQIQQTGDIPPQCHQFSVFLHNQLNFLTRSTVLKELFRVWGVLNLYTLKTNINLLHEPFCSRSQYGERRILFFLLLRLWINSFGFTM